MSLASGYDPKHQVRQAIDIVSLVETYIPLRRQGRHFVGTCPWHDDKRPSLQVNPDRQTWKCWVCDIGGDIFDFVMQREQVDFREALEMLAEQAGVSLHASNRAAARQQDHASAKRTLFQAVAWAEQQFHEYFVQSPDAETVRRYVETRGITRDSIDRFRLGCSPMNWQWLLDRARTTSFSTEILLQAGLLGQSETTGRYYDRFRGRLIFPIRDTQKRVIAFGGRILPQENPDESTSGSNPPAKYVNSPESRLFSKSEQLYGLDFAIESVSRSDLRQLVVVEGYTDVIMAHQAGLKNVVAVLGTALGERHIGVLQRFADRVILVLDGDEAGQKRTNQILEIFVAANVDLRILTLPSGLDPFDFLHERGAEPFQQMVDGAVDALQHKINTATAGINLVTDTHRATQALDSILSTIAKAPRGHAAQGSGLLREQQILARLSREFQIAEDQLRVRLNELRRGNKRRTSRGKFTEPQPEPDRINLVPVERELLELLLLNPELVSSAINSISREWLASETMRHVFDICQQIQSRAEPVEFSRILLETQDPHLKSFLVGVDEEAQEKVLHVQEDAASRLQGLVQAYQRKQIELERREELAALENRGLDEQQELDVLRSLIEQKRDEQGISAPTDG